MEVNHKSGTRNSWYEMDIESRQAVSLAEQLVEGKRGVVIGKERISGCTLEICYGHNLFGTEIYIADRNCLQVAFYSNGYFYDNVSKQQVELF